MRFIADATISELKSSKAYLLVQGVLFDLKTNANNVRVTEKFMDEIVNNKEKYIGNPLCADVSGLIKGRKIDHRYNKLLDEFSSQIIGSMIDFEKEETDEGARCVFTAKILKRYRNVCSAVSNLFDEGKLKFSFEVLVGEYTELADGTMLIDASEKNYLEGAAIVTFPACEEAVALQLVAECLNQGDENMNKTKLEIQAAEDEAVDTEVQAETEQAEENIESAEQPAEENVEAEPQAEQPAEEVTQPVKETTQLAEETTQPVEDTTQLAEETTQPAETTEATAAEETVAGTASVNAAIYVTEEQTQINNTYVYDDQTGETAEVTSTDTIRTSKVYPENQVVTEPAETESTNASTEPEASAEATASAPSATIEALASSMQTILAEIAALREEIASLKNTDEEPVRTVAEAAHVTAEIDPFTSDMPKIGSRWTLLNDADNTDHHFSLLDKA